MKRPAIVVLLAVLLALAGCGQKQEAGTSQTQTPPAATTPTDTSAAAAIPAVSPYDSGPRAGEAPVNTALAAQGEGLFKTKGCIACHAFGKKLTCPDLKGVTMRRTALWMEHQILHPEKMTKEDPIAHQLFLELKVQMTNQGLTEDQARAVIEFLKRQDKAAGVTK